MCAVHLECEANALSVCVCVLSFRVGQDSRCSVIYVSSRQHASDNISSSLPPFSSTTLGNIVITERAPPSHTWKNLEMKTIRTKPIC